MRNDFVAGLVIGEIAGRRWQEAECRAGVVEQVVDRREGEIGRQADPRQPGAQRGAEFRQRKPVRWRRPLELKGFGRGTGRRGEIKVHVQGLPHRDAAVP